MRCVVLHYMECKPSHGPDTNPRPAYARLCTGHGITGWRQSIARLQWEFYYRPYTLPCTGIDGTG